MSAPLAALQSCLKTIRWSGSDLARSIGCTPGYINAVVTGRKPPSRAFVRDVPLILGPILGVDPSDLRRVLFTDFDQRVDPGPTYLDRQLSTTIDQEATSA
jgi:hypothetical protein